MLLEVLSDALRAPIKSVDPLFRGNAVDAALGLEYTETYVRGVHGVRD